VLETTKEGKLKDHLNGATFLYFFYQVKNSKRPLFFNRILHKNFRDKNCIIIYLYISLSRT